jgi:hypothetical protein
MALAIPPAAFYGYFEFSADRYVEHHALDPAFGNALKHASAAAFMYRALRLTGIGDSAAEGAVNRMGLWNERAEQLLTGGKRDSTLEMMKDLHNNIVGIGVARWRETSSSAAADLAVLTALGERGILLVSRQQIEVSARERAALDASADLDEAEAWLTDNRRTVLEATLHALDKPVARSP